MADLAAMGPQEGKGEGGGEGEPSLPFPFHVRIGGQHGMWQSVPPIAAGYVLPFSPTVSFNRHALADPGSQKAAPPPRAVPLRAVPQRQDAGILKEQAPRPKPAVQEQKPVAQDALCEDGGGGGKRLGLGARRKAGGRRGFGQAERVEGRPKRRSSRSSSKEATRASSSEPAREDATRACSMKDLCEEDKDKIAKLLQQVLDLSEENERVAAQVEEAQQRADEAQEQVAASAQEAETLREELGTLSGKFNYALSLLRAYQLRVRDMHAALAGSNAAVLAMQADNAALQIRAVVEGGREEEDAEATRRHTLLLSDAPLAAARAAGSAHSSARVASAAPSQRHAEHESGAQGKENAHPGALDHSDAVETPAPAVVAHAPAPKLTPHRSQQDAPLMRVQAWEAVGEDAGGEAIPPSEQSTPAPKRPPAPQQYPTLEAQPSEGAVQGAWPLCDEKAGGQLEDSLFASSESAQPAGPPAESSTGRDEGYAVSGVGAAGGAADKQDAGEACEGASEAAARAADEVKAESAGGGSSGQAGPGESSAAVVEASTSAESERSSKSAGAACVDAGDASSADPREKDGVAAGEERAKAASVDMVPDELRQCSQAARLERDKELRDRVASAIEGAMRRLEGGASEDGGSAPPPGANGSAEVAKHPPSPRHSAATPTSVSEGCSSPLNKPWRAATDACRRSSDGVPVVSRRQEGESADGGRQRSTGCESQKDVGAEKAEDGRAAEDGRERDRRAGRRALATPSQPDPPEAEAQHGQEREEPASPLKHSPLTHRSERSAAPKVAFDEEEGADGPRQHEAGRTTGFTNEERVHKMISMHIPLQETSAQLHKTEASVDKRKKEPPPVEEPALLGQGGAEIEVEDAFYDNSLFALLDSLDDTRTLDSDASFQHALRGGCAAKAALQALSTDDTSASDSERGGGVRRPLHGGRKAPGGMSEEEQGYVQQGRRTERGPRSKGPAQRERGDYLGKVHKGGSARRASPKPREEPATRLARTVAAKSAASPGKSSGRVHGHDSDLNPDEVVGLLALIESAAL